MFQKIYGSCRNVYLIETNLFPFVAARKLIKFRCSNFYESGILWWVGQIKHIDSLMCNLLIKFVAFIVERVFENWYRSWMGLISLFLLFIPIFCWMVLFESSGSICSIGTTTALLWKMVCSLANRTGCKWSRYRRFCVLVLRIISLLFFVFQHFTAFSINVTWFFTVRAYDCSLLSVQLAIIWSYCRPCGYW